MPLAHNETVALRPVWLFRIDPQNAAEIESGENVRRGEIASGMTQPRMMSHRHRAQPDLIGTPLELICLRLKRGPLIRHLPVGHLCSPDCIFMRFCIIL